MNKKLITTIFLTTLATTTFVGAQNVSTSTLVISSTSTPAQVFTACSQLSIGKRDTDIADARAIYNDAIADALTARKEAEVKLVGIDDPTEKKLAIKASLETYKSSVKAAQDALIKARSDAWTAFGAYMKVCNDTQKDNRKNIMDEKRVELKNVTTTKKIESKQIQAVKKEELRKADSDEKTQSIQSKTDEKPVKNSFLDQLDSIFGFFKANRISTPVTVEASSTDSK